MRLGSSANTGPGEKKYYLANLPSTTDLRTLAATIKARWICEQAHQQMKEELGLDHFEGRSWQGLHRHALMTMLAFAFLQHRRERPERFTSKKVGLPPAACVDCAPKKDTQMAKIKTTPEDSARPGPTPL
jgi:SRSO17 transposase